MATIQARLDPTTERLLARLRHRTGLSDSEIRRRALAELDRSQVKAVGRRIVGLGRFASGCADLGSNKAHLDGFGRS